MEIHHSIFLQTIDLLWKFGSLESEDVKKMTSAIGIEALKCLANIQVILPSLRILFSEYQKLPLIVSCLKLANHSLGSSFLCLRLLFFASATKTSLGNQFVNDGVLDLLSEVCYFKTKLIVVRLSRNVDQAYSKMKIGFRVMQLF
jgi:hypothetical protein